MFRVCHPNTAVAVLCYETARQAMAQVLGCNRERGFLRTAVRVIIAHEMIKDVTEKLRRHLAGGVKTECRVVYLLAQIRKILEEEKPKPRPMALWMFCHWALHVNLSRSGATSHFLHQIDAFTINKNIKGLPKPDGKFSFADEHCLSKDLLFLTNFRQQLRDFLHCKKFSTRICDNDKSWFGFMSAYAGVIEDGTLSIEGVNKLRVVDKVTFTKGRSLSRDHHVPFTVQWDIHLKDRRIVRMDLKTVLNAPANSNMYFSGLTLIPAPIAPPVARERHRL
jgi:hypothetical protein